MTIQERIEAMESLGYSFDFHVCENEIVWIAETSEAHDSGDRLSLEYAVEWAENHHKKNHRGMTMSKELAKISITFAGNEYQEFTQDLKEQIAKHYGMTIEDIEFIGRTIKIIREPETATQGESR